MPEISQPASRAVSCSRSVMPPSALAYPPSGSVGVSSRDRTHPRSSIIPTAIFVPPMSTAPIMRSSKLLAPFHNCRVKGVDMHSPALPLHLDWLRPICFHVAHVSHRWDCRNSNVLRRRAVVDEDDIAAMIPLQFG